ncbi:hypothetical protein ABVT39_020746 [Epinephelus coioides]
MLEGNRKERTTTRSTEAAAAAAAEQEQLTLAMLVTELEKARSNITETITTALLPIQTALEAVKHQVESFEARFTEAEGALSDHSDRITTLETSIEELQSTVQDLAKENEGLKDTLDGYENRQRRMNLRVLGVAEDSERGQCPLKFMSELLVKVLNDESFTKPPELERCHRALMAKPSPDAHPRPFILCFHRYQERERVLQLAIKKRQLSYGGKKILIFPEFSARLVAKRSSYKKVKAQLHEKDIKFSLRYPATLVVYFNGSRHSFSTAQAAEAFFNQHLGPDVGARSSADH